MKMKKRITTLFIIMLVFILGCSQQADIQQSAPDSNLEEEKNEAKKDVITQTIEETKEIDDPKQASESDKGEKAVKEFVITAKNFDFNPSAITVNKGDRVRFKITSIDINHGFAIDEFNINERLKPGKEVVIEFIADKVGEFRFYCSVFCGSGHREMDGTLIVK